MPEPRTLEAGATLDGTYTIDALIGRGGMGAVYRASHARLPGKQVAIKILHAELDDDDRTSGRLLRFFDAGRDC